MSVTLKVCVVTAALNLSQTFSVIMALRRSRRLQQLQPEETNLGVCLICQGDFTIEVLHRLSKSDCCETLFHRCCFSQMMEHTSRCPACRHEHEPENPRALELPDDLDLIEADSEEAELQLLIVNDPQGTFATLRFQAQVSERFMSTDLAVCQSHTDRVRHFGPFCHISYQKIIFLLICLLSNHLVKPMSVIRCIYTDLLPYQFPFLLL